MSTEKKFKFLLIQAFALPAGSKHQHRVLTGPKEKRLMSYDNIKHLFDDVEWDLHQGALAPYGDWPVENREEFCLVAAGRLPIRSNGAGLTPGPVLCPTLTSTTSGSVACCRCRRTG